MLTDFALHQWRDASLLHRLLAPLRRWRQGSWLLPWGDWIGLGMVLILLALAPFVSTTLIGVLMLACAGLWGLLTLSDEAGEGLTPIHLMVVLFWGVMVLATALSPVKMAALKGLVTLSLNLLLFLLMTRVLRRSRARNWLVLVLLLTSLPVSVYGLRQYIFGAAALATWVDPTSTLANTTRVYSYLGNPNLLAAYLIPATMFSGAAIFAWNRWLPKGLALMMAGLNALCLILTLSRGGWVGFVVAGFVLLSLGTHYLSIRFTPFWQKWALPLLLGGAVGLVAVAILGVDSLQVRVMSIFAGREDSSNNFRQNVWDAVIDMIKARPILGIGPGHDAFNSIYPYYQRPRFTALSAYSIFLQTAVEAGAIGFLALIWLVAVALHQGWTQLQRLRSQQTSQGYWLLAAIATQSGMLAHGLVDTVWYRPQISTLWWLMMALVASFYHSSQSQTQTASEPASGSPL